LSDGNVITREEYVRCINMSCVCQLSVHYDSVDGQTLAGAMTSCETPHYQMCTHKLFQNMFLPRTVSFAMRNLGQSCNQATNFQWSSSIS